MQPTILLAEDDPLIREMVTRVLERRGSRVLVAGDGAGAVALFREQGAGVDVVVLDVHMPNLEGPGALEEIRAIRPGIPAVLVSGKAYSGAEVRALARAGVRFVAKPFRAADLARLIGEIAPPRPEGPE